MDVESAVITEFKLDKPSHFPSKAYEMLTRVWGAKPTTGNDQCKWDFQGTETKYTTKAIRCVSRGMLINIPMRHV